MQRNKKSRFLSLLILFVLLVTMVGFSPLGTVAKEALSNFDYGDVEQQVDDYSFYTPPENMEPLKQPKGSLMRRAKVKNVILLIGDGMGLAQTSLARLTVMAPDERLHLERFPVTGVQLTHSHDKLVTDSAASGTALACGIKTDNGIISQDPDGVKYVTVLEAAKEEGLRTGLVVTSTITHATPASFAGHNKTRKDEIGIAVDMAENRVDVMLGGGRGVFLPKKQGGLREDGRNLLKEMTDDGYAFVATAAELEACDSERLVGLFQMEEMTTFAPEPTLEAMTRKALGALGKSSDGFFLMVEGSQIDWAAHANNQDNLVKQVLTFDLAVKAATDFAVEDGQTLVVVCADHETGALSVFGKEKKSISAKWNSGGHSGLPIIVYAYGPGSQKFSGVYDNTDIAKKLAAALGIDDFPRRRK